nr:hypothetical protein KV8917_940009 [Klebsiella variicola]
MLAEIVLDDLAGQAVNDFQVQQLRAGFRHKQAENDFYRAVVQAFPVQRLLQADKDHPGLGHVDRFGMRDRNLAFKAGGILVFTGPQIRLYFFGIRRPAPLNRLLRQKLKYLPLTTKILIQKNVLSGDQHNCDVSTFVFSMSWQHHKRINNSEKRSGFLRQGETACYCADKNETHLSKDRITVIWRLFLAGFMRRGNNPVL